MDALTNNALRQRRFREREREKKLTNALYKVGAAFVGAHALGTTAQQAAKRLYGPEHGLNELITRAASTQATLTTPGWAAELGHAVVASDLIQPLTALSAAAALMEAGMRVSLANIGSLRIPGRLLDPAAAGDWIAEGQPIKVRQALLSAGPILTPFKIAVLTGYTMEQAISSSIDAFVRAAIIEATGLLLDQQLLSSNPGDASKPPGILANATTVAPDSSGNAWAISKDIGALVQALANHGAGLSPVLIAAPAQAAALRMWRQESFYDVFASVALAAGTVVAVESTSFVSDIDDTPRFEVGTGQTIYEDDTNPATDLLSGSPVKSYFQVDAIGLKMILRVSWGLRNPQHVAQMSGVSW